MDDAASSPFSSLLLEPAFWSYGLSLAAFALFTLQLAAGWRGGYRAAALLAAVALSALWAASGFMIVVSASAEAGIAYRVFDALRFSAWLGFLLSILYGARFQVRSAPGTKTGLIWVAALGSTFLVAALIAPMLGDGGHGLEWYRFAYGGFLGLTVLGLATVEQLFRRTPEASRWHIKPLCLGLGGSFAFGLYMYADALLFSHMNPDLWSSRGIVEALVIPFVALSTARSRDWTINITVSRGVVFHSTALLAAGVYLLTVAAAGYYVRYFGGTWGRTMQVGFLFAALLTLAFLFSSGTVRSQLRVFINKHFFSYRYDYREEWLKINRLLSVDDAQMGVYERCIKALADLVESPGGALWLNQEPERFIQVGRWNMPEVTEIEPANAVLVPFLARTGWVVDLDELASSPDRYPGLRLPAWISRFSRPWLIVPLRHGDEFIGFVVLAAPRAAVDVNWEVRDILKTAARQVAGFVGHIRATDALVESRKFDAFNRMSAFVVHDLKNLVSQLSLMLKNAERHRANPEFQRDMLSTIQHAVDRMKGLLLQLRAGEAPLEKARPVDLGVVVSRVAGAKIEHGGSISCNSASGVETVGHPERLERVIGHLVQNALDATAEGGAVCVSVFKENDRAVVEILDEGVGMSPDFVRNDLFRPFRTTKSSGTGIGAYESARYISELGGRIEVDSSPGKGTRMKVLLPIVGAAGRPDNEDREVA